MTYSPINVVDTSFSPRLLTLFSTWFTICSICSIATGRFSAERINPRKILSRLNSSRSPFFLMTNNGAASILSNVVKRKEQLSHSLLLRIARPSSACRLSITRELLCWHLGHLIFFTSSYECFYQTTIFISNTQILKVEMADLMDFD